MKQTRCIAGLVLPELAMATVVVAVLATLLLVAASESRRHSSLGDSIANLRHIGEATACYGADNADQLWNFTWRRNTQYDPSIPIASSDAAAQAYQACAIIRRRVDPEFPLISGWVPHIFYSHLILIDYLDAPLPSRAWASPEDATLLQAQDMIYPPGSQSRFRFGASYERSIAFWSRDARQLSPFIPAPVQQTSGGAFFLTGTWTETRRDLSEVRFPAGKALMYDQYQRHLGPRAAFFAYEEARVPVVTADGGVALRRTGDGNQGFRPADPLNALPTRWNYISNGSNPPPLSGDPSDEVSGYYRWTRSGLRGRDFGGPDVPWVD